MHVWQILVSGITLLEKKTYPTSVEYQWGNTKMRAS